MDRSAVGGKFTLLLFVFGITVDDDSNVEDDEDEEEGNPVTAVAIPGCTEVRDEDRL